MEAGYAILEHPADLGIEARGATIVEAFQNAARALMSIILDDSKVEACEVREISTRAIDAEHLLVKWLSEILYLFDGQQFVAKEFLITELTSQRLEATIRGERFSKVRHQTRLDVKAVTYHQLEVRQGEHEVTLKVFLDI